MKLRPVLLASIACIAALPTLVLAQDPLPAAPPAPKIVKLEPAPKVPADIYDTTADAKELVAAALKRASRDNKRVRDERAAEINAAHEKARREAEERKKQAEKKAGTGG